MTPRRPSAHQRGYGVAWRRARRAYLAKYPLCRMCEERGELTSATVVDHIVPHRGDPEKFWNPTNLQGLCAHCHDSHKQAQERGHGGCGPDGAPLDPDHHWNR